MMYGRATRIKNENGRLISAIDYVQLVNVYKGNVNTSYRKFICEWN